MNVLLNTALAVDLLALLGRHGQLYRPVIVSPDHSRITEGLYLEVNQVQRLASLRVLLRRSHARTLPSEALA